MKFLILLALLVPSISLGAGWETCESLSGTSDGTINPFSARCTDLLIADLTSDILYTGMCDNIDVIYNPDTTGSATTANVVIYSCVIPTVSTNNCIPIDNQTLTGAATSFEILGAAAEWIYVLASEAFGTDTPRVLIRCNK